MRPEMGVLRGYRQYAGQLWSLTDLESKGRAFQGNCGVTARVLGGVWPACWGVALDAATSPPETTGTVPDEGAVSR